MASSFDNILQLATAGITLGALYALLGLGMLVITNVLNLVDLLRGDLAVLSAYAAWAICRYGDVPLWIAFLPAVILGGLVGVAVERSVYRPLAGRARFEALIAVLGLSLALQGLLQLIFGPGLKTFVEANVLRAEVGFLPGIFLTRLDAVTVGLAVLCIVPTHVLLTRSRLGRAIKAISDNEEAALACGVSKPRTLGAAFFLASGLSAAGGVIYGVSFGLEPSGGFLLTVKAFIVSALAGGRGALGTVLAALILGFVETFSSGFFSTNYQDVYVFAAALAVLLFWPEGIGALKSRRYA